MTGLGHAWVWATPEFGPSLGLGRRTQPAGPNPQESAGNRRDLEHLAETNVPANWLVSGSAAPRLKIVVSRVRIPVSPSHFLPTQRHVFDRRPARDLEPKSAIFGFPSQSPSQSARLRRSPRACTAARAPGARARRSERRDRAWRAAAAVRRRPSSSCHACCLRLAGLVRLHGSRPGDGRLSRDAHVDACPGRSAHAGIHREKCLKRR